MLTDAFFKTAIHLKKGRFNADSLTIEWKKDNSDTLLVTTLTSALHSHSISMVLDSLQPQAEQYRLLKKYLAQYISAYQNQPWDALPDYGSDNKGYMNALQERLLNPATTTPLIMIAIVQSW